MEKLEELISDETAAIYLENPSYLGCIEPRGDDIAKIAHDHKALFIVGVDPISLGLLRPPGNYCADIVIGEGQPLGNHMNFGGPMLGIFAINDDPAMIRQVPGRLIGLTTTQDEDDIGFCMALQTREQHIRRHKATSNICSNESLCAIASAAYLTLLGPQGLRELGETILLRSHYTMKMLSEIDGVTAPIFNSKHFKEFTVGYHKLKAQTIHDRLLEHGVHGGVDVSTEYPKLGNIGLYCVTEVHSQREIDQLVEVLKIVLKEGGG
jgi:glycine dehydrogenase subunit 1